MKLLQNGSLLVRKSKYCIKIKWKYFFPMSYFEREKKSHVICRNKYKVRE